MVLASTAGSPLSLVTDVLVVGGGLAGGWAATAAARAGADVVLLDKGYFGTSGVTATAGPGHWWVSPDGDARRTAIAERLSRAHGLADPDWMERILETTWRTLPTLAPYHPFPRDHRGETYYRGLRGPEYLRALREQAEHASVRILDHSPALELLLHRDGSVAGAAGVQRQLPGGRAFTVRAAAVILATGGCAFRSRLLGSHNNTGDGYTSVATVRGGLAGFREAGFELFQDVNSYSKAFGELVESRRHTPALAAEELHALIASRADVAILDARRFDEYSTMSIPTSTSVPGAELVLRARAVAPDPKTTIVVNCAGRTRSIIGTQSLINAGLANPVFALRNGTIGWTLAGQALRPASSAARARSHVRSQTRPGRRRAQWPTARACAGSMQTVSRTSSPTPRARCTASTCAHPRTRSF